MWYEGEHNRLRLSNKPKPLPPNISNFCLNHFLRCLCCVDNDAIPLCLCERCDNPVLLVVKLQDNAHTSLCLRHLIVPGQTNNPAPRHWNILLQSRITMFFNSHYWCSPSIILIHFVYFDLSCVSEAAYTLETLQAGLLFTAMVNAFF
jgi:hypothetical protein